MGSATSRRKKVAPATVQNASEIKMSNKNTVDSVINEESKIPKPSVFFQSRNRVPPDCHSEGHDSEFSADDDIDVELEKVLSEHETGEMCLKRKTQPLDKTSTWSKMYGLSHFRKVDNDNISSTFHLSRSELGNRLSGTSEESNKKGTEVLNYYHNNFNIPQCSKDQNQRLQRTDESIPPQHADSSGHVLSPALPDFVYDGSEEEMMNIIEREYS